MDRTSIPKNTPGGFVYYNTNAYDGRKTTDMKLLANRKRDVGVKNKSAKEL